MKKTAFLLLCALTVLVLFPMTARADIGPKPSVVVDFHGLDGETYYATLLSRQKTTGPYSALGRDGAYAHYNKDDEHYEIFLKFAQYEDADGYYYLQFLSDCTQTHRFSWTYYPPREFKILLYFPETDSFVVSDKYERYAFDSYFTAEITDTGLTVKRSYDYTYETLSLIARIVLTIAAEFGIALLFGFRERDLLRFIVLVNIITQVALNVALNIINYRSGEMAFVIFYVLLEIAVLITEAVVYSLNLKKRSQMDIPGWKPPVYALAANAVSFALGLGLAIWIPGIF